VVEENEILVWTDVLLGYKEIAILKLESISKNETKVRLSATSDGFLISIFFSSKALNRYLKNWLDQLKIVSEK
jgi:hypothetical protein